MYENTYVENDIIPNKNEKHVDVQKKNLTKKARFMPSPSFPDGKKLNAEKKIKIISSNKKSLRTIQKS